MKRSALALIALIAAHPASAQNAGMTHAHMQHGSAAKHTQAADPQTGVPTETGQSAFATIQEITQFLEADPATDWTRVDLEALRQHLIDMDNVTLRAEVASEPLATGARFTVSSSDPRVRASIRNMVLGHATTMTAVGGWTMSGAEADGGAVLTVTGMQADATKITGLGFIGIMTLGMHHQTHHLALARGEMPH